MSEQDWGRTVSGRYPNDALVYRDLWALLLRPHGQALLASLPLSTASRIVDVGSGCGSLLPDVRNRAPGALAISIDRAPGMLAAVPAEISSRRILRSAGTVRDHYLGRGSALPGATGLTRGAGLLWRYLGAPADDVEP